MHRLMGREWKQIKPKSWPRSFPTQYMVVYKWGNVIKRNKLLGNSHEILSTCTWKRVKESSSISTLKLKRWGDRFVQILCSFWKHLELHHFQNAGEQVPSPPAACLWQPSCLGSSEGFCFEPPPDPRPPPENLFLLIPLITFVLRVYLFFINSKYFQISRTNCKPLEIRTKSNVCFVERGQ